MDVIWTAVGQCLRLLRLLTPGDWCSARGRVDLARCRGLMPVSIIIFVIAATFSARYGASAAGAERKGVEQIAAI